MPKRGRGDSVGSTSSSDSLFSFSSNCENDTGKNKGIAEKNSSNSASASSKSNNNDNVDHSGAAVVADSPGRTVQVLTPYKENTKTEQETAAVPDGHGAENASAHAFCPEVSRQHENRRGVPSDDDSLDDRFGTSPSDSGSDEEAHRSADDIRERLMAHVQVTSGAKKSATVPEAPALGMANPTQALHHLRDALLSPVTSTALTIVSATDESHQLMDAVVAAKLPPPPADEVKRLRKLKYVDHSTIEYSPIQKEFYVTPPDVKGLRAEELKTLLRELDGAKVRGRDPPRPMRSWTGSGLADSVLETLSKEGFHQPFAVQSLGAPALMSGRDLLVVAKTGSGKTLSYLLPLIRHCMGQRFRKKGEGPVALVLVPTHELGSQIVKVAEKLCAAAQLQLVASYGLTSLADNIRQCRAGCDVIVATPGRLLDLLTVSGGGVLSMRFVSFVVVDEADRMFDSGFSEHVNAFLKNIRPDRQLAMFSATMPKELRKVVMGHLHDPIEITVGGKPTPASNVEQRFFFFDEEVYEIDMESRGEEKKFLKLLQILGEEGGNGEHLILIFTQRKEECDELFARLSACGYQRRIAVLYGGMDPIDREFALEHFSPGNQFILVATGVAERGLDIPYLELVVNYSLPDHFEAYVHRIGRTGRAGRKGKAVSFFTRGRDDELAADLCEGLERAEQQVPEELYERAAKMREMRKDGMVRHNALFHRGYMRAKKLHFTSRDQQEQFKAAMHAAGVDGDLSDDLDGDSDDSSDDNGGIGVKIRAVEENGGQDGESDPAFSTALTVHRGEGALTLSSDQQKKRQQALEAALAYARKTTEGVVNPSSAGIRFEAEYPINDLPKPVRLRLQSAAVLRSVSEETESSIIRKGVFYDTKYKHSHRLQEGIRPLYLLIMGKTAEVVREAVKKLNDIRDEALGRIQKNVSALGVQL
ncbi:unnamed protein product [Trypanosoma congolense IL3000]|uniref:Probable eukaryotic initiation factor 4A n=1 Tax=Trypanosoma congolense (strain IL3000) TaxID=1068625 RepID=F9W8F3_TRYCI|nr:unnamed protein product [Trypanosoma congolense IL3000]